MTVKMVGAIDPTLIYAKPPYGQRPRPFHLVNLDIANPVYFADNSTITAQNDNVIYQLGRAGFDGESDVYCSTATPGVTVAVMTIPGGSGWDAGPIQTAMAISSIGVPPQVPDITTALALDISPGASPYSAFTFPARGRVWGVNLAGSVISDNCPVNSRVFIVAQIGGMGVPGSGTPLGVLELGAVNGVSTDSDVLFIPQSGLDVNTNQNLYLVVNGGTTVTSAIITGSAVFYYSIP